MKAKAIIFSIMFSVMSFGIYAQSGNLKHQTQRDGNGKPTEIISTDIKTSKFIQKNKFTYDSKGNRKTKTLYLWNKKANCWLGKSTTEYSYDINGNLLMIAFSEWDKRTGAWSKKTKNMVYHYDESGRFLSIDRVKSECISNTYLTQNKD